MLQLKSNYLYILVMAAFLCIGFVAFDAEARGKDKRSDCLRNANALECLESEYYPYG